MQACHAVDASARQGLLPADQVHPHRALLAVKGLPELEAAQRWLTENGVRFALFEEEDLGGQPTALASETVTGERRKIFRRFSLLKEKKPVTTDHKCTDTLIDEFNTGAYKDRAGRGYHPYSYETHLKLKFLKKMYWLTARSLAEHFRWAAKQSQNRVRRHRVRDDKGRVLSVKVTPWTEPPVYWMFVTRRTRQIYGTLLTVPQHMADFGILRAYEEGRKPRSKEEVLALKPTLITVEVIDKLFDDASRWQAEGILDLIKRAA